MQKRNKKNSPKYHAGWRRVVSNFSPSWFSTTMGTGIVAILFHIIPFGHEYLRYVSLVFFILNFVLFATVLAMSLLRYTLYPEIWSVMIQDPTNSLFLATCPMGFATLIELWVLICVPIWGEWTRTLAWALWILDAVAAASVTVSLSFILYALLSFSLRIGNADRNCTEQISRISQTYITSLERITALQLLPIAATIVAAGTGAEVAEILPDPQRALATVLVSYVLWGMGAPLAMTILVIYYQRLAVHKLPSRETIVSCFLPLGPLGFGGFGILYLGKVTRNLLASHPAIDPVAGSIAYTLGFFISLLMWSFGLIWLVFAMATIYHASPFPFNMGWWGFTFPLGVYAANTILLGQQMDLIFFQVFGTILAAAVVLLWLVVGARTVHGAWHGSLFYAPCLQNLKDKADSPEAIIRQA
ncbi:TDT family transporter [Aspergillus clavatus NRRL 1]|uniref:C4-dicarboxylate transporter/malic acid transport protein n=1 Tax=Aspergillus clavatus (strain ATCC 1007 / CBS 513.65 / DSM 816 / NCTC 3887 / NRRL 1 / QM 1276 / 107) TaxID=344612 RepID=A1CLG5_ASPCL|nr:C4-dicarboxylate transporter/malic acid transport protein [Aspergillus clavatus NRRL 1]EAW09989.1 C4-dicarboxylate transporter/malic acid transport protein [Aspergillus clavatus NRRL 1]